MKPSFYNVSVAVDGRTVIYNTLYGAILEVDECVAKALGTGELDDLRKDEVELLVQEQFLVPEDKDELAEYAEAYESSKSDGSLSIQLKLAATCNLNCTYCYQDAPVRPNGIMTAEACDRLVSWVTREFSENKPESFSLELYGGEPLLAKSRIPSLLDRLRLACASAGVPVHFSAITNGTLFHEELVDVFIRHEVATKISIDGTKEMHDARRVWNGRGGAYEKTMHAIEAFLARGGGDLLTVRMNFDRQNIGDVEVVARQMHAMGVKHFECGSIHFRKPSSYGLEIPEAELDANHDRDLFELLSPLGYASRAGDLSRVMACGMHKARYFALTHELRVFKCDELDDSPEHAVGQIDDSGRLVLNQQQYAQQVSRSPTDFQSCRTCRYLPTCGSGCAIRALSFKGDLYTNYCQASEHTVRERVRSHLASSAHPEDSPT